MRLIAIGGSDAGISAALRARELDPNADVTVVVADAYPNFSICGIPYYVSGEVVDWRSLAHRTVSDLEATGMTLRLDAVARHIDPSGHTVSLESPHGEEVLYYDAVIVATGAVPVRPPIDGLDRLGADDGVHLLHTMGDTFALLRTLEQRDVRRAVIVGGGYVGLEMAEALTTRGLSVTQIEQLPEVLPTVDPELGLLVHTELERNGVSVQCGARVDSITAAPEESTAQLLVRAAGPNNEPLQYVADVVLVSVGVRPDSRLGASAGVELGVRGAIVVDQHMHTNLADVFAAGDCVVTNHRQLGMTYVPLGTTAHKQGRIAGENALGGSRAFAGSLGTQVVKVFDLVAARTGLRDYEATSAGRNPVTITYEADDHKRYYPGAERIAIGITGDRTDGRLLGVQLVGRRHSEIAKRIDTAATALFHDMTVDGLSDLDLSYTPPFGSPWDALQAAAQKWTRAAILDQAPTTTTEKT